MLIEDKLTNVKKIILYQFETEPYADIDFDDEPHINIDNKNGNFVLIPLWKDGEIDYKLEYSLDKQNWKIIDHSDTDEIIMIAKPETHIYVRSNNEKNKIHHYTVISTDNFTAILWTYNIIEEDNYEKF